jgi:hypothetical protein
MAHPAPLPALLVAALLALAGAAPDSRAGATVDLLFVAVDSAPIAPTSELAASAGQTLTMGVFLRSDERIGVATFSLRYDLDGGDELDVARATQWRGVATSARGFFMNGHPLDPVTPSFVGSFSGFGLAFPFDSSLPPSGGAFAGGYQMGTVVWTVKAGVESDGADVVSGLLQSDEGIGAADYVDISSSVAFRSASVDVVPEPATAALLGLGLAGLAALDRRRGAR